LDTVSASALNPSMGRVAGEGLPRIIASLYPPAMDTRSPEQRRRIMQAVKSKDTRPELVTRRLLHAMGYRFRLHRKDLPGRPDIVLPKHRKVIFVHGCFWHAHGCPKGQPPKSRPDYWLPKLEANVRRDDSKINDLRAMGWKILIIWQCETRDHAVLAERLQQFVDES
jgi:DNA mismatch endonuclease (patch repair protein)